MENGELRAVFDDCGRIVSLITKQSQRLRSLLLLNPFRKSNGILHPNMTMAVCLKPFWRIDTKILILLGEENICK